MSQFGARDIQIFTPVQQAPDLSGARMTNDIGRAFASAIDTAGAFMGLQRQQIEMRTQFGTLGRKLGSTPEEVGLAAMRLEREELQTQTILNRLQTQEAAEELSRLREVETNGWLGEIAGTTPEEKSKWWSENAVNISDPEVMRAVSANVADSLSASLSTQLQSLILKDYSEGEFDVAASPSRHLPEVLAQLEGHDPDVRAQVERRLVNTAYGYARGVHENEAKQYRAEQARMAVENIGYNAREFVTALATGIDSDEAAQSFARSIDDAARLTNTSEVAIRREAVANTLNAARNYVSNYPEQAKAIIDGVYEYAGENRPLRDALSAAGFRQAIEGEARKVLDARTTAGVQLARQKVKEWSAQNNAEQIKWFIDNMDSMEWPSEPSELQKSQMRTDAIEAHTKLVKEDSDVAGALTRLRAGKSPTISDQQPSVQDRAFQTIAKEVGDELAAVQHMVRSGWGVPKMVRQSIANALSPETLDLQSAYTHLRNIAEIDPALAGRTVRKMDNGGIGQTLMSVAGHLPPDDPQVARAIQVLSSVNAYDAIAEANATLKASPLELAFLQTGDRRAGAPLPSAPHAMIATSLEIKPTTNLSSGMIRDFENYYRFHSAEAMSARPNSTPEERTEWAMQRASERLSQEYIDVQIGESQSFIRRSTLGGEHWPAGDDTFTRFVNRSVQHFAQIASEENDGAMVLPEQAVRIGDKTYIAAATLDDGTANHMLEIDPRNMSIRVITSGSSSPGIESDPTLFQQVQKAVEGEISPSEIGPFMGLHWKPDFHERTVEAFDVRFKSNMRRRIIDAAVQSWHDRNGPPDIQSEAFAQYVERLARDLGWDGFDVPRSGGEQ